MPTDAGMISCIVHHLHQVALGARVDKIHQPDRDSITLQLYTSTGTQRLELCASSERPFIGFTTSDKTAPQHPTQFCLLLRKHLASGGRVTGVEQIGFDRALRISFDAKDDMGFVQQRVLVYETMGKFSNVVLCDPTKILGVLRPVDFATSSLRQLLVGMTYQPPPPQDKGNPLEETEAGFANRASATSTEQRAERFIMNNYAGFSPLIAREIAYRATGQTDAPIGGNEGAIWQAFSSVATAIREGSFAPTLLSGEGLSDYSFCDIAQYGESAERRIFDTPSQLLQTYLGTRVTKGGGFAHDISVLVRRALAKAERKIETITADLAGTAEREKYRIWGELITANIHAIKPRMDKVEVQDYYSENLDTVEIPLDPRLSPAANAQRYYRLYSKQKKGQILGTQQLEAAEGELKYLQSVQDSLSRVTSHAEAAEIRREL
ncbi:MAG: NFACT family protein, partial [Oscillospiraceae bacterium]|nr:NFACT family protein [Oscillospiraceae bacterium]